jgi:pyrophosphatase PpaX
MLDKLKSNGFTLGIVTSTMHKTRFEGQRIGCAGDLERLGIAGLFTIVIGHEDVQKLKPNPECIGLALDKIGIAPENTFVAGDTLADIQAAKAAGCRSCQAVWGIEGEYQDNGADFIARTPADVLAILKHSV